MLFSIDMNLNGKTVWITGAGSGIGKSLAQQCVSKGAKVILSDINDKTLQETVDGLANGSVIHSQAIDVGDRDMLIAFIKKCIDQYSPVDIVINNAGTTLQPETVNDTPYEDFEWLFNINMWGVLIGSKEFLPHLLTRPEGYIVNISSVFGIIGYRKQGPYCMTKFAVRGLTESMRVELLKTNVKTLSVHPGGIATNIVKNAKWTSADEEEIKKSNDNFLTVAKTTPDQAAATIIKAIEKNKNRVRIGFDARMIDYMARFSPEKAATWIANQYDEDLV